MESFEKVCKSRGLRLTHQRLEIFLELANFNGHPTAENIYNRVSKRLKMISLDTVYRTITLFEKNGLIKRVHLLDNSARFDINLAVHHHLICTKCKKVEDFYWPIFDRIKLPGSISNWGDVNSRHVEIHGICRKCKKTLKK